MARSGSRISSDIRIDRTGLDNLASSIEDIVWAATKEASSEAVQTAKALSRVRTGDMESGWTRQPIGSGRKGGYRIYNPVPYTIFNEFGTVYMSAQPMLGPAMIMAYDILVEATNRAINDATEGRLGAVDIFSVD